MEKKQKKEAATGLKFAIQAAVSCVGLWWVYHNLRNIDWSVSGRNLAEISWPLLAASTLLFSLTWGSRLWRLRLWTEQKSGRAMDGASWVTLYLKSIALGAVTPARLGDFSRITLLTPTGLSLGQRSRLVLLDKLAELLYIPVGFCLTAWTVGAKIGIPAVGLFLFGLAAMAGTLLVLFWIGRDLGMVALLRGWLVTILGFMLFIGANAVLFHAAGIYLTVLEITAVILTVGVLVAMPVSVGGLGIREGSLLSLLVYWGVNSELIAPLLLLEFFLNMLLPLLLLLGWTLLAKLSGTSEAH